MTGRVTVVIPHWNRRELLARLLEKLSLQTEPLAQILVVDNGSTDGSAEAAEAAGARVIRLKRNEGFAHAVNLGIVATRTEWVAVINNDVEPEPEWLQRLLDAAVEANAWFATGKICRYSSPDTIDGTFDLISRGACAWRAGEGKRDGAEWSKPRRIRITPFTAAVFRCELFAELGGLDEEFGSYLEDVDFGIRCAMAGREGVYVPEARALHQASATLGSWTPEMVRFVSRNQLLLVGKHYPKNWFRQYGRQVVWGQLLYGLMAFSRGCGTAFFSGKREAWKKLNQVQVLELERPNAEALEKFLGESEAEILRLQEISGFDRYWRWYFKFAGKVK
jgi:GT2 family glycosyltransferase